MGLPRMDGSTGSPQRTDGHGCLIWLLFAADNAGRSNMSFPKFHPGEGVGFATKQMGDLRSHNRQAISGISTT